MVIRASGKSTRDPDAGLVPAVARTVRLLDRLAASRQPQTLGDLVRSLKIPKSSLHGLLQTLETLGLVRRGDNGGFSLGAKSLQWSSAFQAQSDVVSAFNELAASWEPLAQETVMMAVLDGRDVTYLGCRPGTKPLAVTFRVGGRFPASCTASGKAMLATMPFAQVRERLGGTDGLQRMTRHSVGSLTMLASQLTRFRAAGYAIDDEETAEGMHCVGAPVFAAGHDEAVAAVAVSLIKAGTSAARKIEIVAGIRGLADAISHRLGGLTLTQAA